ncbi:putative gibberellin 20-oxidase [Macrophomina phaseolina]|uniref:Gibberellin 20-oxidase n=1 Tax=Macrophomina phaseolina TaxID=35725 RepID=A0ABQ8G2J8_9PEZI|nr:putative gibberellin 20-oxidase [Macrophomina phaseolina]
MSIEIRTLDFSKFHNGTDAERKEFARGLFDGWSKEGFVKIINHGFTKDDFDQLFEWNRKFFGLPEEEKTKVANPPTPNPQRGWTKVNGEKTGTLNQNGITNLRKLEHGDLEDAREHFDVGPPNDEEYPNRWPAEEVIPGFQAWIETYFRKGRQISLELMEALEIATNCPKGYFAEKFQTDASELRLNHYPSVPVSKLETGNTRRIWPHTDFGVVTLLIQDGHGGLEIHDKSKPGTVFVPVKKTSDTEFIINIGDTLERLTNGVLKATLHQVTSPPHLKDRHDEVLPSRHSIAFFLKADRNVSVGAMDHFISEKRPAAYDNITALEFQNRRTNVLY